MKKFDKEVVGTTAAIITAVISGFAIPLNKIFVVDLDPIVFAAIRALIVGAVFLAMSYAFHRDDLNLGRNKTKGFKSLPWAYLLAIGLIGGCFAFMLFFSGLQLTDVGRAAFIHKTLPIWVTMFAYFLLREYVHRKQVFAMLIMLLGVFFIIITPPNFNMFLLPITLGDMLVLIATILWALEAIIARHAMLKNYHHFFISFGRMFFGGIFLFGAVVLLGRAPALFAIQPYQFVNILISTAVLFGYVFFWYTSIHYIRVSKAATLLLLAPVISLLAGVFLLGESAPIIQLLGSALILIGAWFVVHIKSRVATGM